jgi:hypothetical protein
MFLVVLPLGIDYSQHLNPVNLILAYVARPYTVKVGEASESVELKGYSYRCSKNWQWNVPYGGIFIGYLVHNLCEGNPRDGRGLSDRSALRRCPSHYSLHEPRHTVRKLRDRLVYYIRPRFQASADLKQKETYGEFFPNFSTKYAISCRERIRIDKICKIFAKFSEFLRFVFF